MTTLERILTDTVCTETAGSFETIECACGCPNASTEGVRYGKVLGSNVVVGCTGGADSGGCLAASRLGNVIWQDRHLIAKYLRAMADQMLKDRTDLLGALPVEMGRS